MHKYDYGVQECVLGTSRLQDGIVSLKKLVGVFPDGVSIDQECSIEVEIEEAQSVFVYVAVVERDGAPADRYVRYTAQVKDYYLQISRTFSVYSAKFTSLHAPPLLTDTSLCQLLVSQTKK